MGYDYIFFHLFQDTEKRKKEGKQRRGKKLKPGDDSNKSSLRLGWGISGGQVQVRLWLPALNSCQNHQDSSQLPALVPADISWSHPLHQPFLPSPAPWLRENPTISTGLLPSSSEHGTGNHWSAAISPRMFLGQNWCEKKPVCAQFLYSSSAWEHSWLFTHP